MFRFLLYIFLIYLAYQFIFKFIIPVYKTTQQVKKGFRDMSARMNQSGNDDHMNDSKSGHPSSSAKQADPGQQPVGEYIDFEEIK